MKINNLIRSIFSNEIIKDFFSYGFIGVLSKLISVFVLPFFISYLTAEEFGILEIFNTTILIFALFSTLQLETSFLRFFVDFKSSKQFVSNFSTGINTAALFLFLIVILFLFCAQDVVNVPDQIFIIIALLIPIKALLAFFNCIFRVKFERSKFIMISMINVIGQPLLSIIFIDKYGIYSIVYSTLFTCLVSLIASVYMNFQYYEPKISVEILKKQLNFSLPLIPAGLFVGLQQHSSKYFITNFLSLSSLGQYSLSLKIFIPIVIINQSLKLAWYPRAYSIFKKSSKSSPIFSRIENIFVISLLTIYCVLYLLSNPIISFFGDIKWSEAIGYTKLVGLVFLIRALSYFYIVSINIVKKTKYILFVNLVGLLTLFSGFLYLFYCDKITVVNIILIDILSEAARFLMVILFTKLFLPKGFGFKLLVITIIFIAANILFR